jgi:hypothetical protein
MKVKSFIATNLRQILFGLCVVAEIIWDLRVLLFFHKPLVSRVLKMLPYMLELNSKYVLLTQKFALHLFATGAKKFINMVTNCFNF